MRRTKVSTSVRRSIALPRQLIDEVTQVAPADLRNNLNRLVTVALRDYVAKKKSQAFEKAMAEMATDPAIRAECLTIGASFASSEGAPRAIRFATVSPSTSSRTRSRDGPNSASS